MQNKRGISHIEMIMAFIIFIGAVLLTFTVLDPIKSSVKSMAEDSSFVSQKIINNVSIDLYRYTIFQNNSVDNPLATNPLDVTVALGFDIPANFKVLATNESGYVLAGINSPPRRVCIDRASFAALSSVTYIILGEELVGEGKPSYNCVSNDDDAQYYSIGSSLKEKVISENRTDVLAQRYASNYNGLKNSLGIADNLDFAFSLYSGGQAIIAEKNVPIGMEIYSTTERVQILKKDGKNITYGEINVKVW